MVIAQVLKPSIETLGPLLVRRLLPAPDRQMVGPFIFMDQAGPTRLPRTSAEGVPEHPHAGLATFTYLLEGSLLHRDSAGHEAKVRAGDVALMTAGRGITHEERPNTEDLGPEHHVYFVQTWLALPDAVEDAPPAFELHQQADIPEVDFNDARAWVLIGAAWDKVAPTTQYTETVFADLDMRPGGVAPIVCSCAERALYVLEGDARLEGAPVELHTLTLLEDNRAPILSSEHGCRAILLGGAPFPSRRFIAGSFVASSEAKIEGWTRDYQAGRFPHIERCGAAD